MGEHRWLSVVMSIRAGVRQNCPIIQTCMSKLINAPCKLDAHHIISIINVITGTLSGCNGLYHVFFPRNKSIIVSILRLLWSYASHCGFIQSLFYMNLCSLSYVLIYFHILQFPMSTIHFPHISPWPPWPPWPAGRSLPPRAARAAAPAPASCAAAPRRPRSAWRPRRARRARRRGGSGRRRGAKNSRDPWEATAPGKLGGCSMLLDLEELFGWFFGWDVPKSIGFKTKAGLIWVIWFNS